MKIQKLRLKNFLGVKRGLGLDEISVDFENISGLVALDGLNGAGKSTLLENLGPYNQLASREGALHRHTYGRDAEKELSFEYHGNNYRTLLKIDSEAEKSEGYIWVNGTPVVNGKISAYAKYMRDLFGSPELFYNSVFCSQNAQKLSDMTTGKLKELFAEFLRLDKLSEYEATAKQCAAVIGGKVSQIDMRIAALKGKAAGKDETNAKIAHGYDKLRVGEEAKTRLIAQTAEITARMDELKAAAARAQSDRQRLQDAQAALLRLENNRDTYLSLQKEDIAALLAKHASLTAEARNCDIIITLSDQINGAAQRERDIAARLESLQGELTTATGKQAEIQAKNNADSIAFSDIRQAMTRLKDDAELRRLDALVKDIDSDIEDEDRTLRELSDDRIIHDLTTQIKQAQGKLVTLTMKDPACTSTTCSFIVDALRAQESLGTIEAQLAARTEEIATGKVAAEQRIADKRTAKAVAVAARAQRATEIDSEMKLLAAHAKAAESALHAVINENIMIIDGIETTKRKIDTAKTELASVKAMAARQGELQVAIARKADLSTAIAEIVEAGKTARTKMDAADQRLQDEIAEQRKSIAAIANEIDPAVDQKLAQAREELNTIAETSSRIDDEISAARDNITRMNADLVRIVDAEREIATAQGQRDAAAKTAAEWTYLKDACGKNGLQALEIDGAAPIITGYANDLLNMAFGPLFSVKFRTQDDEGREVLDIVTIGDDGEDVMLENLSGGQRIWILMALRLATTLLSKEKSGHNYESFFSDELDGPLDPENSVNFVNMYRAFMKIGGFTTGYFISHKPSCRALAEYSLKFVPGQNPAWR